MTDTSSTMTNEGDSTFESSPQYPVHYEILKESDTPTLGTPDYEELEIMRQQGAIPKRPSHRPLPPIPIPTQAGTVIMTKNAYSMHSRVRVMLFKATLYNISVISWLSVLLVQETGIIIENHDLSIVTDKLYHIMLY